MNMEVVVFFAIILLSLVFGKALVGCLERTQKLGEKIFIRP